MKYITLILDGSADRPNDKLAGKTPLEYAATPHLDALALRSKLGRVRTIPQGLEVGSAVANMSLLGFDPHEYKGRAVIEAAGAGLPIVPGDLYIRANFVHFSGNSYDDAVIENYSAYDIETEESEPLTELLSEKVFSAPYLLHNVGTFRNILQVQNGKGLYPLDFAPAHDIIGQPTAQFQTGAHERPFYELQRAAYGALAGNGTKANGVWLWGASVPPSFAKTAEKRCALSETILMRGITALTGIDNYPTREPQPFPDFLADKLAKAKECIAEYDKVYIHIQATDDLSHDLDPLAKAAALEQIDSLFLPGLLAALASVGDYSLLIASDHYTFSDTGGHGDEPAPFLLYRTNVPCAGAAFTEQASRDAGFTTDAPGLHELIGD